MTSSDALIEILAPLNEGQQTAVLCSDPQILCLAGAGTGKTYTMLSRIYKLIDVDGVDPSNILALTFTNAAAFEMANRYRTHHPEGRSPEFRTFHAFCYSLIAMNDTIRRVIGYDQTPEVIDEAAYKRISSLVRETLGIKLSNAKLNDINLCNLTERIQYDLYHKGMDTTLRQANQITFDIMARKVTDLFIADHPAIKVYKNRYKYIMVDEFQDTDPQQYAFVTSFHMSDKFIVGDALQALYGFRGADSSLIKQLSHDSTWTTIRLTHNYRSTKQICDFANKMSIYADDTYRIPLEADREGPKVAQVPISKHITMVYPITVNDIIKTLATISGESAVLCRTNATVDQITEAFEQQGQPFRMSSKNDDALHILNSALNGQYLVDWLSTYLPAAQYTDYIRAFYMMKEVSDDPKELVNMFVEQYGSIFKIKEKLDAIFEVRHVLADKDRLPFIKCHDILNLLGYQHIGIATDAQTPEEIIAYLLEVAVDQRTSNVYVGTIHSAKGLEYDNVFLVGVDTKMFPLNSEENMNIYYVGITRAKTNLFIWKGAEYDEFDDSF